MLSAPDPVTAIEPSIPTISASSRPSVRIYSLVLPSEINDMVFPSSGLPRSEGSWRGMALSYILAVTRYRDRTRSDGTPSADQARKARMWLMGKSNAFRSLGENADPTSYQLVRFSAHQSLLASIKRIEWFMDNAKSEAVNNSVSNEFKGLEVVQCTEYLLYEASRLLGTMSSVLTRITPLDTSHRAPHRDSVMPGLNEVPSQGMRQIRERMRAINEQGTESRVTTQATRTAGTHVFPASAQPPPIGTISSPMSSSSMQESKLSSQHGRPHSSQYGRNHTQSDARSSSAVAVSPVNVAHAVVPLVEVSPLASGYPARTDLSSSPTSTIGAIAEQVTPNFATQEPVTSYEKNFIRNRTLPRTAAMPFPVVFWDQPQLPASSSESSGVRLTDDNGDVRMSD